MGVRFEEFRFADVFTVEQVNKVKVSGKNYVPDSEIISDDGTVPYIAAISTNNGITGYSSKYEANNKGDCITLSTTADSSNTVFYQPEDFIGRQQIAGIRRRDKQKMGKYVGLYIVAIVKRVTVLFNYGTKLTVGYLRDKLINLPIKVDALGIPEKDTECYYHKDGYIPDFEYMERYIAELEQERIAELEQYLIATGLNDYTLTDEDKAALSLIDSRWDNEVRYNEDNVTVPKQRFKEFKVKDILKLEQTKAVVAKSNLLDGNIPYVTRTTSNNGYMGYCGNTDKINCGNCITIGAETAVAYYQPNDFVAGNKIYRLSHKDASDKSYLFLVGLLNMYTHNYSYSNARIPARIKEETIMLPVNTNDEVDWSFMERYIRAIEKVVIADVVKYKDEVIAQTKALVNK